MRNASTVLTAIGAAASLYFVVAYWILSRGAWRKSPAGRHLMAFTANLGVLFVLISLARLWPDYPFRSEVTLVAFAGVVGQIVYRSVLLHQAQHRP